jgi:hypothetical protein
MSLRFLLATWRKPGILGPTLVAACRNSCWRRAAPIRPSARRNGGPALEYAIDTIAALRDELRRSA